MEEDKPSGNWAFRQEGAENPAAQPTPAKEAAPVSWTASEFIESHKSPGWYMALFAFTTILSALIYFVFHDIISVVFIVIVSIMFAILGSKRPRQLAYRVDDRGITVGDKFYPYAMFKSFSVLREGAVGYINLLPLKRFMPELSIYFGLEDEQKIVDVLVKNLPYEHRDESAFDRLMKKLHF